MTAKCFDIKASTDRCRSLQCSAPGQHVTMLCRKALWGAYARSYLESYITLKKKKRRVLQFHQVPAQTPEGAALQTSQSQNTAPTQINTNFKELPQHSQFLTSLRRILHSGLLNPLRQPRHHTTPQLLLAAKVAWI